MERDSVPREEIRALWLAELSEALDEALILLDRLVAERIDQVDADLLRVQIEEIRAELRVFWRQGLAGGTRP
ncbi:hypothetical protein LZ518_06380 [Sphingomonas sp. RB56-2]|uniref:Uncharacterized protein n=1 Tax=Sphingomonas brevis TaxID=2908206 RepID=A0ABT0S8V8_9SPHN|nr:hypothetical protein [Sphingomonas brevis]MCL6740758.1 hypothetical protein [Sphingomonas brevis]